jgi:23S rRNA pseudouridine955/2504/2580 synthase/23S rRNA pseudouridine1911/1915/1917 synthase
MTLSSEHIIFENDNFVAINKPSGMLSIPDREQSQTSLKELLQRKYNTIFTVHRLDKDTSGLILFAKDEHTHKYLSALFENRGIEKYYVGLVNGKPAADSGTIDSPLQEHAFIKGKMMVNKNGKAAITDFDVLESFNKFSLLRFHIHTGRTHQIRVHSANMGNSIACDPMYGSGEPILLSSIKKKYKLSKLEEEERPILNRLALHSYELKFNTEKGEPIHLTAPLPKDMQALLQQLRKLRVS